MNYTYLKKIFITNCLFILCICSLRASTPSPDLLVYNNDTLYLYKSLMGKYEVVFENDTSLSRSSARGNRHIATWEIDDGRLYLKSVIDCFWGNNIDSLAEEIIGRKFINGRIYADWVTEEIYAKKDFAFFQGLWPIFNSEYKFTFLNGNITDISIYGETDCKININNYESISNYVINNMDLSDTSKLNKVNILYEADLYLNNSGLIDSVKLITPIDTNYSKEFISALQEIPCLKVYFDEGKPIFQTHRISVSVNDYSYNKYVKNIILDE